MSGRSDGMADLAGEVIRQLAKAHAADNARRPYIRATAGWPGREEAVFLSIKHQDGRATWAVKHGPKDRDQEVRFAQAKEESALYLFTHVVVKKLGSQPLVSLRIHHIFAQLGSSVLSIVNQFFGSDSHRIIHDTYMTKGLHDIVFNVIV